MIAFHRIQTTNSQNHIKSNSKAVWCVAFISCVWLCDCVCVSFFSISPIAIGRKIQIKNHFAFTFALHVKRGYLRTIRRFVYYTVHRTVANANIVTVWLFVYGSVHGGLAASIPLCTNIAVYGSCELVRLFSYSHTQVDSLDVQHCSVSND